MKLKFILVFLTCLLVFEAHPERVSAAILQSHGKVESMRVLNEKPLSEWFKTLIRFQPKRLPSNNQWWQIG